MHTCLSACPSSCLSDWLCGSLQRYVKNAKLDKDQRSGHTESHKDVQCLEFGERGSSRGWMDEEEDERGGRRVRGWE